MNTQTDFVRRVAETYGTHLTPDFYRWKVYEETGVMPSHGTVISAIGRFKSRQQQPAFVQEAASGLLETCEGDFALAKYALKCVFESQRESAR